MFHRAEEIAGQRVHHRDGAWPALQRALESFSIDPVTDPICQLSSDAGIVDVPDGGVVEPAQCLRFTDEPGPGWSVGVKVYPQSNASLEDEVLRLEEHSLHRRRYGPLQLVAEAERSVSALEIAVWLGRAQRSNPRRRSTFISWPQIVTLHHRRV